MSAERGESWFPPMITTGASVFCSQRRELPKRLLDGQVARPDDVKQVARDQDQVRLRLGGLRQAPPETP